MTIQNTVTKRARYGGKRERAESRVYTKFGDPGRGGSAKMKTARADAMQNTGVKRGQYGDNRENGRRGYAKFGGAQRGAGWRQ